MGQRKRQTEARGFVSDWIIAGLVADVRINPPIAFDRLWILDALAH